MIKSAVLLILSLSCATSALSEPFRASEHSNSTLSSQLKVVVSEADISNDGYVAFSDTVKQEETIDARIIRKKNEKSAAEKRSDEWYETIHKAAPGADWKEIEARSIAEMIARSGSASNRELEGMWVERGPSNIPGRITDVDIDFDNGQIYALSDHGIVFQSSDLEAGVWIPKNDRFPLGLDVSAQLEVFQGGDLVAGGFIKSTNDWGVFYSEDQGLSWTASSGLGNLDVMGYRRLLKDGDNVYLFSHEYSPTEFTDFYKVYKSVNRGVSFNQLYVSAIPVGDGWRHSRSDMWISNNSENEHFYLSLEDSLFLVNKTTGERTFNSLITEANFGYHLLSGHEANGVVELRAYSSQGDAGKFYAWNSIDNSWTYRGEMTEWWLSQPFGANSLTCSATDADVIYFGGILISKSEDGGQTWTTMDLDPTGSYALYHGDVPKCFATINPTSNEEIMMIGTDGGLYQLDMPTQHFEQLSIPGLNCTQMYKMVSKQSDPGSMFIGTQDNGYSYTTNGTVQQETVDFTFQWGGDVSNVASGDGGETFWLWWLGDGCNYQNGPAEAGFVSNWSPYEFDGQVPYWEAPIWISNHFPDRCYTAGYINGTGGSHIIELTAQPGEFCTSEQFSYDFEAEVNGRITAIAISPINSDYFYVTTDNGYFCLSTDGGENWTQSLISSSMYPRAILPSSIDLNQVWVIGSGYSNSPVFHTINNGDTWTPINDGLPSCIAEAIATNEDESLVFLATSIGPFVLEGDSQAWEDLSTGVAPLVHYMDVEYITQTNTVRFATYARGIWDFQMDDESSVQDISMLSEELAFPNPCADLIYLKLDEQDILSPYILCSSEGKALQTGIAQSTNQSIHTNQLPSGSYFVRLLATGKTIRFVKR
jgi:photosystem II stability/assembly factor-like uncharacterized protein